MSRIKQQLFDQFAQVAQALSNGRRLELLELLAQTEYSVEELAKLTDLSIANVSQHLQRLKFVGLVMSRADGRFVRYRIASDQVIHLVNNMTQVGQQNVATIHTLIDTYLHAKDQLEPISGKQLLSKIRAKEVFVIDVRPAKEFATGHVPGAKNMTLQILKKKLSALPKNKKIVAYCRGPYCLLAVEAIAMLRKHGFQSLRFEGGYPEWKLKGYPIAVGAEQGL